MVDGAFSPDIYAIIRDGCRLSASIIAPVVQATVGARSVIDVGGGEGWWASAFVDAGCGRAVSADRELPDVRAPGVAFDQVDLGGGEPLTGDFDLAVCLEVAEHLPDSRADYLVATLCGLAPVVLFSAAIPGQGGHGHVNERWPPYWATMFELRGYAVTGDLRWLWWGDQRVEPWYAQNLLLAARRDLVDDLRSDLRDTLRFDVPIPSVVHPTIYQARLDDLRAWEARA